MINAQETFIVMRNKDSMPGQASAGLEEISGVMIMEKVSYRETNSFS